MPSVPQPGARTPVRRARSVRRTTTHACTRPEGLHGPIVVTACGRDVRTDGAGRPAGHDDLRLDVEVAAGSVTRIESDPIVASLAELVGTGAYAGFRRRAAAAAALEVGAEHGRDLLLQLVDDLPTALMLSGRVLRTNGISLGGRGRDLPIDICAGWVAGGTLVEGYTELGPPIRRGPRAARTDRDDDPAGWHEHDPLPAHATRRRRRIDLWFEDRVVHVASFFRDTHAGDDAVETVVHQYAVEAEIDPASMRVLTCTATPGPLPYPECPGAAASADRLRGLPIDGLRSAARQTLTGTSTCTHLTDALGALEGVAPMVERLLRDPTGGRSSPGTGAVGDD